mmetsp:Transcript_35572/g.80269  ORF Transcript_35572/g.80269 Transcript_35572/m.80269 type:complete len:272 (-) Transcript_35572:726-1541(-)
MAREMSLSLCSVLSRRRRKSERKREELRERKRDLKSLCFRTCKLLAGQVEFADWLSGWGFTNARTCIIASISDMFSFKFILLFISSAASRSSRLTSWRAREEEEEQRSLLTLWMDEAKEFKREGEKGREEESEGSEKREEREEREEDDAEVICAIRSMTSATSLRLLRPTSSLQLISCCLMVGCSSAGLEERRRRPTTRTSREQVTNSRAPLPAPDDLRGDRSRRLREEEEETCIVCVRRGEEEAFMFLTISSTDLASQQLSAIQLEQEQG